jgi:hypothetical protein
MSFRLVPVSAANFSTLIAVKLGNVPVGSDFNELSLGGVSQNGLSARVIEDGRFVVNLLNVQ